MPQGSTSMRSQGPPRPKRHWKPCEQVLVNST
jgi:hypothetical protein